MSQFSNIEDALQHMENPLVKEETKWKALAEVLRQFCLATRVDRFLPINEED